MPELPTNLKGAAHVYERAHINTDEIIPARYLTVHEEEELAKHAMEDIDTGFIKRVKPGDFLIAGDNFGCGSSREHAPWALLDQGFRCVIAASFADIFYNNCFQNGVLPVVLDAQSIDAMMKDVMARSGYQATVDLAGQTVTTPEGTAYRFSIDPFRKDCLYRGLDSIGLTLQYEPTIAAYEARRKVEAPWLFSDLRA
jgi:3-isopropylmalate/(R)-2-methylmalate dehydratase small subunit